ncbi:MULTISPECIES: sugar-binding transcriptional regulator [unclassified Shinella]|uniref:sugar-binding transcriptional regulator n=1 Tax=unclassified Shinella TaxID=2643062 RepID=UPI00225DB67A|nr:sugar-binding transcriptional regulator [Shinella sp. YE25]MDC7258708.1 sugar-binding transcriptional regulator [Shinella sp. YE25]CAI0334530.1 LacI family transcriptional regulator [Rhizobiaceae bacterium]CAK7260705.1 deoxyribonucleoside regulator [Shinella sp. WSC3-e]
MNQIVGGPVVQSEADRLRARVAWLYHVEGHTQNEIANRLGINRVMVVRMLAEARRRNEVRISITSPLSELVALERALEAAFDIRRVVIAPFAEEDGDPAQVIAAAAGAHIAGLMAPGMSVGVGWGTTLYNTLPFITGGALEEFRVISLLGGISAARRFNPAEFAWQFAELFRGEGYLVPAPAVVDSPETKHALLERCGLAAIFEMADKLDVALLSVGGIANLTTSYRTGYLTEADRRSLVEAGAVGDVLYNFIDAEGNVLDHEVNQRVISVALPRLRRTPERILVSGGREKRVAIRAALRTVAPTTLITDEQTASALLAG